jgi:hypothetical protein
VTLAAPPALVRPGRLSRLAPPVAAAAVVSALTLALRVRDPHSAGSWGYCPTALVGLSCPFCGSLRAVNDLGHLDLGSAASSNLLLVLAVPVAVVLWLRWAALSWSGTPAAAVRVPRWVGVTILVVLAAFTVARNVPGSWLAP